MRLVATSSCALVIFLVDRTVRIFRRSSCTCPAMTTSSPGPGAGPSRAPAPLERLGLRLVDRHAVFLAEEHLLEVVDRLDQRVDRVLVELLGIGDLVQELLALVAEVVQELPLEA